MLSLQLQCLLGIQCNDFTMLAADQIDSGQSVVIIMKKDEQKLHKISENILLGVNGEEGDAAQFTQFLSRNLHLYKIKNGYELGTSSVVHFTRKHLAEGLRSQTPVTMNLLIAGYDKIKGSELFYMDYLASCIKVPFAAHGFGGLLSLSILDRYYKPTLSMTEAYEVLRTCVCEVHERLFVNLPTFQVMAVTSKGIEELPIISSATCLTTC